MRPKRNKQTQRSVVASPSAASVFEDPTLKALSQDYGAYRYSPPSLPSSTAQPLLFPALFYFLNRLVCFLPPEAFFNETNGVLFRVQSIYNFDKMRSSFVGSDEDFRIKLEQLVQAVQAGLEVDFVSSLSHSPPSSSVIPIWLTLVATFGGQAWNHRWHKTTKTPKNRFSVFFQFMYSFNGLTRF